MRTMRRRHGEKGFTLLEIIVVLAVIGALAAILSPVVFRYIDDANRARAAAETRTIAAAIQQMYKDTGRWPFYAVGTGQIAYVSGTDASVLSSDPDCSVAAAAAAADACLLNAPGIGSSGWVFDTAIVESIASQLRDGNPSGAGAAYSTTGARGWRGPYLDTVPDVDPWGRNYVVNIGDTSFDDQSPEVVVVLSAGVNGIIETSDDALATAGLTAGGDDIIARVK